MKIEEQVLSREQMAHLKELGVDTSDASMCWMVDLEDGEEEVVVFNPIMLGYATCKLYPTYTIGDLIEKLPTDIKTYSLVVESFKSPIRGIRIIKYGYNDFKNGKWLIHRIESGKTHKDMLYKIFCWVAENHKELIK